MWIFFSVPLDLIHRTAGSFRPKYTDSPYANIIAVRGDLAADKRAAVDKLVKALQSEETRKFILEKYNGKVIPAKL